MTIVCIITYACIFKQPHPPFSESCGYDISLDYTVVIEESTGVTVEQRVVTSDSCRSGLCSTSFTLSAVKNYIISVRAGSVFGQSGRVEVACIYLTTTDLVLIVVGAVLLSVSVIGVFVLSICKMKVRSKGNVHN